MNKNPTEGPAPDPEKTGKGSAEFDKILKERLREAMPALVTFLA